MDRLDCQFIMALCTNVHYAVFIAPHLILDFKDIIAAVATLDASQREELSKALENYN